MNYCPKCGNELIKNAAFCPKCGYNVNEMTNEKEVNISTDTYINSSSSNKKRISPASKASMVLGIIAIIFAIISLFIALGIGSYYSSISLKNFISHSKELYTIKLVSSIILLPLPSILSIIGLFLGIGSSTKDGFKVAGIILNLISIIFCVFTTLIIFGI